MKIQDKAAAPKMTPEAWAAELHQYVPWCEPEVLRAYMREWLVLIECEAEASFVDREPTDRALRAKLKQMLIIRIRGPKTKAWLQGHTAELRAKRENDAKRASRFRVDPSEYAAIIEGMSEQQSSSEGDSPQSEGDGE